MYNVTVKQRIVKSQYAMDNPKAGMIVQRERYGHGD